MDKSCYNCKHNGKETCKGCSTILEPKFENFEERDEITILRNLVIKLEDMYDRLLTNYRDALDSIRTLQICNQNLCAQLNTKKSDE